MSENKLKQIDKNRLPWFYRLILKIPGANFLENSSSGVFWGIVMPVFLVLEFFLNLFLLVCFPFPLNLVLTATIPVAVLLIFIRISLERSINWWNLAVGNPNREWNVEKTLQEYLVLLKKKEEKNE